MIKFSGDISTPCDLTIFISWIKCQGSKELIINDDDYYLIWLRTLEEFLGETVKIQSDEIIQYFQDWRAAFLNTPHGQPVKLENLSAD